MPLEQCGARSVTALAVQARVLLCNTRVGPLGLNLTQATEVLIIDLWWNAMAE